MKRVPNKKFQKFFRTALLCGVLFGLLFSCGEGIRLFPFPANETTKNDSPQLNAEDKILYQYNIHRLEERQGNQKTKSQRSSQHHYWIENGRLNNSAFLISKTWKIFKFPSVGKSLKLPLFFESGESRAPPFII
jgi:hypothetical protein